MPQPCLVAGVSGVRGQVVERELRAEAPPQRVADHAHKDPLAFGAAKNIVHRPGAAAHRHGRGFFAEHALLGDVLPDHKGRGLEQRTADVAPFAAVPTSRERGQHADNTEHRAADIDDRAAGAHGPSRQAGHIGQTAQHLGDFVQGGAVRVGAR